MNFVIYNNKKQFTGSVWFTYTREVLLLLLLISIADDLVDAQVGVRTFAVSGCSWRGVYRS